MGYQILQSMEILPLHVDVSKVSKSLRMVCLQHKARLHPRKMNGLELEQNMEIHSNEVNHTWKQLIASSTRPASLSALPYQR